ncbi:MAG TPA: hypothetical protein VFG77_06860, partial [Nitrososphaeraceae archaeon]|nr:hypothetical protein [Nitrososphaeraceae archaeon]
LKELEKMGIILRAKAEDFHGKPIRFYYNITPVGSAIVRNRWHAISCSLPKASFLLAHEIILHVSLSKY